jgi:hypothetical protein
LPLTEQALLISRGAAQDHVKAVLEATFGIAFMGTPHLGARLAEWAGPLTRLSNVLRSTDKAIVHLLEPGSEILSNVQQEFHTMLEDRKRNRGMYMEIFCFYEEIAVVGVGKARFCTLVGDSSAKLQSDRLFRNKQPFWPRIQAT